MLVRSIDCVGDGLLGCVSAIRNVHGGGGAVSSVIIWHFEMHTKEAKKNMLCAQFTENRKITSPHSIIYVELGEQRLND